MKEAGVKKLLKHWLHLLWPTPRLEITCKWNKNCTEKIMVPLKFLRKRSSRFGATCWGITTHQANRADGLCKYCKGLPHPSACASLWVVIPQHVAPNLELLFPNYFNGAYGISVQFFLIGPFFLTGCRWEQNYTGKCARKVKFLKLHQLFKLAKSVIEKGCKYF